MTWSIQRLEKKHDRNAFDCGVPSLNGYLQRLASQHARKGISRSYVAVPTGQHLVQGFYSLATGRMVLADIPENVRRRLPSYPIPTAHLGQLAVDRCVQGQGLGEALLFDALQRTARVSEELGIYAVTVDALGPRARAFYLKYGFVAIDADPLHLYLEMKVVRQLI